MIRDLAVASVVLVLAGVACTEGDKASPPIVGVEATDGRAVRLGEPDIESSETRGGWRTDPRREISVATDAGRVVAIVVGEGGADFPVPGSGFGVGFDELQQRNSGFRNLRVADRDVLVLDGPRSRVYALPVIDPLTCEFLLQVGQAAVIAPGYELLLADHLASHPPCKPPPPPMVVFARDVDGNVEVFKRNNQTQVETRLTNNAADDSHPSIVYRSVHRGGSKIVFQSNRDGNLEIYVMELDGSGQRRLTSSTTDDMYPDWSPDERSIVFVSERDGNRELYVVRSDGSNLRRLTDSPGTDDDPAWASNVRLKGGTDIAFSSNRNGSLEVYVMKPDGSDLRMLTDSPGRDYQPAWSPDGTRIAFVTDRDGDKEIYVMNADGSQQTRLTKSPAADLSPGWSPDGNRIRFISDRDGAYAQFSMNADGTGQIGTETIRET